MPYDGKCIWVYGNNQKCNHTKCQECVGLLGNNILTINNKLLDGVVYINGVY